MEIESKYEEQKAVKSSLIEPKINPNILALSTEFVGKLLQNKGESF